MVKEIPLHKPFDGKHSMPISGGLSLFFIGEM
jgi:hypothetical protein